MYVINRILIVTSLLLQVQFISYSQIVGLPNIKNYQQQDYAAGAQNWDVVQSTDGRMYFGNYLGLLQYDGVNWNLKLTLANKSTVWGLAIDDNDRIYLGGNQEIGYAIQNDKNQFKYVSLQNDLPKEKRLHTIIWDVIIDENRVIYQASESLIIYENSELKVIEAPKLITYCAKVDDKVIVVDRDMGFYYLEEDKLVSINTNITLNYYDVCFILPYNGSKYLIGTQRNGVYIFDGSELKPWNEVLNSQIFKKYVLSCATMILKDSYAVGTEENGFILLDKNGAILQHLTVSKGLENNSITSLVKDNSGNLWATLFSGISYIEYNSPFSFIGTECNLPKASSYTSILKENLFYVGTNQGLFAAKWPLVNNGYKPFDSFEKICGGHVWGLYELDKQLFMANHNGLYLVNERNIEKLDANNRGAWVVTPIPGKSGKYLLGTYEGLHLLEKKDNQWTLSNKLKGFNESIREMMFCNDYLWVVHGLQGVYQLKLNKDLTSLTIVNFFNDKNQLPSNFFNSVFNIDNEFYLGTQEGLYFLDKEESRFVKEKHFSKIVGDETLVRRFNKLCENKYFFVKNFDNKETMGVISSYPDKSFSVKSEVFNLLRGRLVPAFEHVNYINSKNIFITSKQGVILYNDDFEINSNTNFATNISEVICSKNDSILFGGRTFVDFNDKNEDNHSVLKYNLNAIRINYASAFYMKQKETYYQTWLQGYEDNWSTWSTNHSREFTNLREGVYTFNVRAKNVLGNISEVGTYTFEVLPPWFRSIPMLIFYTLIILSILTLFTTLLRKRLLAIHNKVEESKQEELETFKSNYKKKQIEIESQLIKIQNDKLKAEVEHKTNELKSSTMHLLQTTETLNEIKERVKTIIPYSNQDIKNKLNKLLNEIDEAKEKSDRWENFELLFEQLHDDFNKKLKEKYPNLTKRDIRLIAYLRMNLTTKEIAPLMGITIRAVDSIRYRIRKKLELKATQDLTNFIINI